VVGSVIATVYKKEAKTDSINFKGVLSFVNLFCTCIICKILTEFRVPKKLV